MSLHLSALHTAYDDAFTADEVMPYAIDYGIISEGKDV